MEKLWEQYLNAVFPTQKITQLLVYTDAYRYWFVDALLAVGQRSNWKVHTTLLDDIDEDDVSHIKQSFLQLPESCLLVFAISDKNTQFESLVSLVHPIQGAFGYSGFSLLIIYNFPDQYLPELLAADVGRIEDQSSKVMPQLYSDIIFQSDQGTYLETKCRTVVKFPYQADVDSRHVIFPEYQVITQLELEKTSGTLIVDRSIGMLEVNDELVDPMGIVHVPLHILIEKGQIVDINVSERDYHLSRRIKTRLDSKLPLTLDTLAIGLAPILPATGFIDIDRLSQGTITVATNSPRIEFNLTYTSLKTS